MKGNRVLPITCSPVFLVRTIREDMGSVTLKQVAREAGCSLAAASVTLNGARGNSGVSPEMRKHILATAKRLQYRTNHAGSSLASRRSRTLGVCILPRTAGGLGNPYYEGAVMHGVETICKQNNYDLLLINLAGTDGIAACIEKMEEHRIDGLVVISTNDAVAKLDTLEKYTPRVVVIGQPDASRSQNITLPRIAFDNAMAMSLVVDHLVELGHTRIGFLGTCLKEINRDSQERQEGFVAAIKRHGLTLPRQYVHDRELCTEDIDPNGEFCQREGAVGLEHMLRLDERPTALVAYNDLVALGVYDRAADLDIKLPDQMSVTGVDDIPLCRYLRPKLTSVRHPLAAMGESAARRVIASVEETGHKDENDEGLIENQPLAHAWFRPELICRESSRALRHA